MKKGMLIVISSPAGGGKDSIIEGLMAGNYGTQLFYSVSATTREIRAGERDGEHYFFKTHEAFKQMIAKGELLEYTKYCGNYYGTLRETVKTALGAGKNIVLKIEVEGAANVRKLFPDCVSVFILPPSLEELRRRLKKRSTEDAATIELRVQKAAEEIAQSNEYDYRVVNDDLHTAIDEVAGLIAMERAKRD